METDDLARDSKADARAVGFGRKEWSEDILGEWVITADQALNH